MPFKEKIVLAVLAAATAMGAMLLASPDSKADASSFLYVLEHNGFRVYDAQMALSTGVTLCRALDAGVSPDDLAEQFYRAAPPSEVLTVDGARRWVASAATELCPWTSAQPASFGPRKL